MDGLSRLNAARQYLDRDLLETFPPEFRIQLLDLKLCGDPQRALQFAEGVLVARCLFVQVLRERSESVRPFARFAYPSLQTKVFLRQGHFGGIRKLNIPVHRAHHKSRGGRLIASTSCLIYPVPVGPSEG